jgi:hypothetical protein
MMKEKFTRSTKAWLKTQDLAIKSCDINIEYYKKCIANLHASIAAEQLERKTKIEMKVEALKNLKKILSSK